MRFFDFQAIILALKVHFENDLWFFQFLQETSPILAVKVKGQEDPILIQTGVKGKLIEVNPAIVSNPKLLIDESEGRGFIAILLPKVKRLLKQKRCSEASRKLISLRHGGMTGNMQCSPVGGVILIHFYHRFH